MLRRADTCHDNLTSGAPLPRADKKTGTLSHRLRSVRGAEAASSWMLPPCIRRRPCRRTDFSPDAARFRPPPAIEGPQFSISTDVRPLLPACTVSPALRLPLNLRPGSHGRAPLPAPFALPRLNKHPPRPRPDSHADFAAAATFRPTLVLCPADAFLPSASPRRQKKRRPGIGKLRSRTALSVTVTLR